jgi:hypothetical protein
VQGGLSNSPIAGQVADPTQPIAESAAVDHERPSCGVVVAAVLVVVPKRLDEIRAIVLVVVDEHTQPLPDETSGLGLFPACQKSVDPEFVVWRDPSACLGRLPHPQSPPRLLVGTPEPRGLRCRSPDADRALSRTEALRHGAVEVVPPVVRAPNGSRDDSRRFVMAACEQRARVEDGSDRTLDGLLESVATSSVGADEQHVLWSSSPALTRQRGCWPNVACTSCASSAASRSPRHAPRQAAVGPRSTFSPGTAATCRSRSPTSSTTVTPR